MKRLLPAVVVILLSAACTHLRGPAPLALGPSDSGKSFDLVVGQTLTIRLAANPSTGYQWQVVTQPDPATIIVTDSGYDRPASDAAGAAGQAWWTLRATAAGSTSFSLRYVRPWEPAADAQTFTIAVKVIERK